MICGTDEYRTLWYGGAAQYGPISLAETWARVSDNAVQTPGYYLLLNRWERVAGDSVFANRYPSLLFGLLALAVVFRAGQELFNPNAALGAAIALGGSAFFRDVSPRNAHLYTGDIVFRYKRLAVLAVVEWQT